MTVGGTQQVMLKVRFAEMQRSVAKNLSASLGVVGGDNVGVVAGTGQFADHGNLVDTLGGATAVSDTHLDVYKRQVIPNGRTRNRGRSQAKPGRLETLSNTLKGTPL